MSGLAAMSVTILLCLSVRLSQDVHHIDISYPFFGDWESGILAFLDDEQH